MPPRVSSTSTGLRYVAARRHLFIGLSLDKPGLSRLHEEDSPPEGRLRRADNLHTYTLALGGGREGGLSPSPLDLLGPRNS